MGCPYCGGTLSFWGSIASIIGLVASVWAAVSAHRARLSARAVTVLLQRQHLTDVHLQPLLRVMADAVGTCQTVAGMRGAIEHGFGLVDGILAEYAGTISAQDERDLYSARDLLGAALRLAQKPGTRANELAPDVMTCYRMVMRLARQQADQAQDRV